jgi:hypothetical protein
LIVPQPFYGLPRSLALHARTPIISHFKHCIRAREFAAVGAT